MKRFKNPVLRLRRPLLLRNANDYADHHSDSEPIKCPGNRRGVVTVYVRWYMYIKYPQETYLRVKRRKVGKVLRRLAKDRRVRDLAIVGGSYLK